MTTMTTRARERKKVLALGGALAGVTERLAGEEEDGGHQKLQRHRRKLDGTETHVADDRVGQSAAKWSLSQSKSEEAVSGARTPYTSVCTMRTMSVLSTNVNPCVRTFRPT
jgi:hypothetical protein